MKPGAHILFTSLVWVILHVWPINGRSADVVSLDKDSDTRHVSWLQNVKSFPDPVKTPYQLRRVVIDAGHGGKDPGCVGTKSKEKDIALAISLQLGQMISRQFPEVEVIYTRKTDIFLELHQRAAIANKANAELFISIHCNAATNKSAYGTETFVLGLHRAKDNLEVAKRENAAIYFEEDYQDHYEGYDPNSPEGHILLSMFQNAFLNQSISFAEKIERNFTGSKRHSRGVKQGGLLVLRQATMPAVLVEVGFLSNPEEEKYLITKDGQETLAKGIFNAFALYKENSERFQQILVSYGEEITATATNSYSAQPEVEFCVQFLSLPKKSEQEARKFSQWGQLKVRHESGAYKYQLGGFSDYESAAEKRKFLQSKGYKDAFIVAYRKSERISVQEAMASINP